MFGIGFPELIVLLIIAGIFVIPGIIGATIAGNKGRGKFGWFVLCAILPILIIVVIFLKPAGIVEGKNSQCPSCKEFIKWDATVCRYCHNPVEASA